MTIKHSPTYCPECGGLGKNWEQIEGDLLASLEAPWAADVSDCPHCDGTGIVWIQKVITKETLSRQIG